ncbi:hypothetical protein PSENEW3n2_00003663 [Picochlorum sp. SENEW3]|nr:hypothetical protein PSENEW3n2_00003663 [Picochlorum sp. SENEW3]WPT18363.1 hypothetical protein PSENEW3_00003663 [Picochlorum sp. SENEW3]
MPSQIHCTVYRRSVIQGFGGKGLEAVRRGPRSKTVVPQRALGNGGGTGDEAWWSAVYGMYNSGMGGGSAPGDGGFRGVIQSGVSEKLADWIHVLDARDAMEACGGLSGEEKEECFVVFGVNKDADLWYDTVNRLEGMLSLETFPEEEGVHRGQERI